MSKIEQKIKEQYQLRQERDSSLSIQLFCTICQTRKPSCGQRAPPQPYACPQLFSEDEVNRGCRKDAFASTVGLPCFPFLGCVCFSLFPAGSIGDHLVNTLAYRYTSHTGKTIKAFVYSSVRVERTQTMATKKNVPANARTRSTLGMKKTVCSLIQDTTKCLMQFGPTIHV